MHLFWKETVDQYIQGFGTSAVQIYECLSVYIVLRAKAIFLFWYDYIFRKNYIKWYSDVLLYLYWRNRHLECEIFRSGMRLYYWWMPWMRPESMRLNSFTCTIKCVFVISSLCQRHVRYCLTLKLVTLQYFKLPKRTHLINVASNIRHPSYLRVSTVSCVKKITDDYFSCL